MKKLKITQWIKEFIENRNCVVLRDKRGTALEVSYTEDGLRWACDEGANSLYYYRTQIYGGQLHGSKKKRHDIIVEKFVPTDWTRPNGKFNIRKQLAELRAVSKALKMFYSPHEFSSSLRGDRQVYTSREKTIQK